VGRDLSFDLMSALVGVPLREVGNGGKAQSIFPGRSGDGGANDRGMGLVALLATLKGGLGDSGEGLKDPL
jgi:hypothetical protein